MNKLLAVRSNRASVGIMLLAIAIFAVTATVAMAANLSGDGTIVGTTGNDNITAGQGNDTVWGLGGSDNINAGNGNDVIDGGGRCAPGIKSGVYPNGLPSFDYCEHGPSGTYGHDNINAGSGNDVVYGNGGTNDIDLGSGSDTVYAYGGPNTVNVGNGSDTIYAYGTGAYNTGTGIDTVYADYNTSGYTINCGSKHTTVYVVKGGNNHISSNCTVKYASQQKAPSVKRRVKRHTKHHAKRHTRHHVTMRD